MSDLCHQALVRLFDEGKRAVRDGAIEWNRAAGLENSRGGDFRMFVFHPIRHLDASTVCLAGDQILDWLGRGFNLAAEFYPGVPPLQIKGEVNGNVLGIEDF